MTWAQRIRRWITRDGKALDPHEGMAWVRHRDTVRKVYLCPDLRPYSSVFWMRFAAHHRDPKAMYRREDRVVSVLDDSSATVTGTGLTANDPLFCPEMEAKPFPQCHCADFAEIDECHDDVPADDRDHDVRDDLD